MWSGADASPASQYDELDLKTEHDQRREQLAASDPVYQLELQKHLRNQVQCARLSNRSKSYAIRKLKN